jgi:diadenylate cyclase
MQYIIGYLQLLRITDLVDIAIVAVIVFYLIKLLRGTQAAQLVKGVALILAVFVLSDWLQLNTLHYIISGAIQIGAFAVIVIFQPELRNLLEHIGRMRFGNLIDFGMDNERDKTEMMIESVVKAAVDLSETNTGALIVIERETALADYIRSGTKIDASVSSRLLENIFVPNTPLHDGAVIISNDRAAAASCLLPLTTNNNISPDLGTRHRAAIGLSECSDAVVIVVSEETGKISIALNGSLTRNLSAQTLTNALNKTVLQPKLEKATTTDKFDRFRFWRSK